MVVSAMCSSVNIVARDVLTSLLVSVINVSDVLISKSSMYVLLFGLSLGDNINAPKITHIIKIAVIIFL